jgi:WD40 repeat protein
MSFFGHTDSVTVGLYSPDGKYLISGSEDFSVKVWELKNQVLSHTIKGKKFHQSPISALAVGRIKSIIATGSFSNELAISNYENGTVNYYLIK